jgi:hypothetical protein
MAEVVTPNFDQQRDPRMQLARLVAAQGENVFSYPTPTPMAALAKALTIGLGGATQAWVGNEMQREKESDQATMRDAALAATTGVKGWTDPDGNLPPIQGRAPGIEAMTSVMAQNPRLAGQAASITLNQALAQQKAKLDLANKLAENGMAIGPNGTIVPIPGFGKTKGDIAGETKAGEISGSTPAMVAQETARTANAVAQERAVGPARTANAVAQARALQPIEVETDAQKQANKAKDPPTGYQAVPATPAAPGAQPGAPAALQPVPGGPADPKRPEKVAEVEKGYRAEFKPVVDSAVELTRQFNIIKSAVARGDGPGDMATITAFNKMLDEGAVVREADVALTLKAQSVTERVETWLKNKASGDLMPPELRKAITELTTEIYTKTNDVYRSRVMPYADVAIKQGASFDNIIPPDVQKAIGWSAPGTKPTGGTTTPPPGAPTVGSVVQDATGLRDGTTATKDGKPFIVQGGKWVPDGSVQQ